MFAPNKIVGTGVLDCPRLAIMYLVKNSKISLCYEWTVEDAGPYNEESANTDYKPTDKTKFEARYYVCKLVFIGELIICDLLSDERRGGACSSRMAAQMYLNETV